MKIWGGGLRKQRKMPEDNTHNHGFKATETAVVFLDFQVVLGSTFVHLKSLSPAVSAP